MDVIRHFNEIALKNVSAAVFKCDELIEIEPSAITTTSATLSPEIIKLGGKLESWENESNEKYFLVFDDTESPFRHGIITEEAGSLFFLASIKGTKHIIKSSAEEISIIKIEDLPSKVYNQLSKLAYSNLMYATIELQK